MKKNLLIYFLIGILVVYFAATSLGSLFIKKEINKALASSLTTHGKIGRLQLSPTSVVLGKIRINDPLGRGKMLAVEHLKINYNLFIFMQTKDFLQSITDINVEKAQITIRHNAQDKFNFFMLLKPSKPTSEPLNIDTLKVAKNVRLTFNKCTVTYVDGRGFGPKAFSNPITNTLTGLEGAASLRDHKVKFTLKGNVNKASNHATILGRLSKDGFELNIHSPKAEIAEIISYFAPLKEINFKKAVAKIDVTLQSRIPSNSKELPFTFEVKASVKEAFLQTVWISPNIRVYQGETLVSNNGIAFQNVLGTAAKETFTLNGGIHNFINLDLHITNPNFESQNAYKFLPFMKNWNLQSKAAVEVDILGDPLHEVLLSGNVSAYKGKFLSYQLQDSSLSFLKHKNFVYLNFLKISAYNGIGSGKGVVDLSTQKTPSMDINLRLEGVSLDKYFDSKHFKGSGDLALHIYNSPNDLLGLVDFSSTTASAFGQQIENFKLYWNKKPDRLYFRDNSFAQLNSNSSKLYFTGSMDNSFQFEVNLKADTLDVPNFYFFYTKVGSYMANASLSGVFKGTYNETFKLNPLQTTKGLCTLKINRLSVENTSEPFKGSGTVTVDNAVLIGINLKNTSSSVNIMAKTTNKNLVYSTFAVNNLPLTYSYPFVKSPNLNYSGLFSGKVTLFPNKNDTLLKNYGVTGSVELKNASIATQNILYLSSFLSLQNNTLTLSKAHLTGANSNLSFNLNYLSTQNFSVSFTNSKLKSSDWQSFPNNIKLSLSKLNGSLEIKNKKINADLDIITDLVSYKNILLPNFKGGIGIAKNNIFFRDLTIENKTDVYQIAGSFVYDFISNKLQNYNFEVIFKNGRLENISQLYAQIKPLWSKEVTANLQKTETSYSLLNEYNNITKKNSVNLYSLTDQNLVNILDSLHVKIDKQSLDDLPKAEGGINGYVRISNIDKLHFYSDLTISDGRILQAQFSKIKLLAQLEQENIRISLKLKTLSILENLFDDIDFDALYNPNLNILKINHLTTLFDKHQSGNILKGQVNLSPLVMKSEETPNDLDLHLSLEKDNINIFSIFNASIKKMSNQGSLVLDITGPLKHPLINADKFTLKNFSLSFAPNFPIKTPLTVKEAALQIKDNLISIPSLEINWKGEETNNNNNDFHLNGTIRADLDFDNFSLLPLGLDINIAATKLEINLPDLYIGKADLEPATLIGNLYLPLTKKAKEQTKSNIKLEKENGPILKSTLNFHDGRFIILANRSSVVDKPSILLNTPFDLGKDLYITGKNFDQANVNNFINNIYIEMDESTYRIPVKGSLNTLDLENKFKLKTGKIVFMNQVFQLLEKSKQREIFRNNPENINDNIVEVKMLPDPEYPTKRKATPFFNLKAYAEVRKDVPVTDNTTISGNTILKTEDHLFVIYINGFLNTPKSFIIEHYLFENNTYQKIGDPIELDKITAEQLNILTDYLLPVLLKPQFYQSLLSKGLDNNKEANDLLKSYSASQINLWINQQLRPFEKEVAKAIGLYDVKIEHKLGEELMNSMPVFKNEITTSPADDNKVSVEYIKDLFVKKLFVKVKTGLNQDPLSKSYAVKFTDYELMWFLSDFISLNYGNHNLQSSDSLYGAFSINANFDF